MHDWQSRRSRAGPGVTLVYGVNSQDHTSVKAVTTPLDVTNDHAVLTGDGFLFPPRFRSTKIALRIVPSATDNPSLVMQITKTNEQLFRD
jgi:hypothetical protein